MWQDLVTQLDAWRHTVPWQFPTIFLICVIATLAIACEAHADKKS